MTKGLGKRRPDGCEHERSGPSRLRPETGSRRVVVVAAEAEAGAAVVKGFREEEVEVEKKKKVRR